MAEITLKIKDTGNGISIKNNLKEGMEITPAIIFAQIIIEIMEANLLANASNIVAKEFKGRKLGENNG